MNFEIPMMSYGILRTLTKISRAAGITERIITHHVRHGGARDLAHVTKPLAGVGNETVAKGLGHTRQPLAGGVTDRYIGSIDGDIVNLKTDLHYNDRQKLTFANPTKIPWFTPEQISEHCELKGWGKREQFCPKPCIKGSRQGLHSKMEG